VGTDAAAIKQMMNYHDYVALLERYDIMTMRNISTLFTEEYIMEKKKWESLNYTLSNKWLYIIVGYFILLLVCGMITVIFIMTNVSESRQGNIILNTTFISISVAAMLCSVQYLKRLYKACLDGKVRFPEKTESLMHFGNVIYFFLRPIFAMAFVIVAVFALLSGALIVSPTGTSTIIDDRFLYLCVVMSSVIGFSIGRVLDGFEVLSSKQVNKALKVKEDTERD
jgi:Na+/melibiose symporter-like transporter